MAVSKILYGSVPAMGTMVLFCLLLGVEEDGHIWLGVPGIYDAREARAADLFGFPQFTSSYISILELTEDECENSESFGHWCRYLM